MTKTSKVERRDHALRDAYLLTTIVADTKRQELEQVCQKYGITIAQYPVLWTLCLSEAAKGLPMTELADGFLTRTADTTRLVTRLVTNGFVTRQSDRDDRRKVIISVTPKGRRTFIKVTEDIKAAHRKQYEDFTDAEVEQLTSLLSKLVKVPA